MLMTTKHMRKQRIRKTLLKEELYGTFLQTDEDEHVCFCRSLLKRCFEQEITVLLLIKLEQGVLSIASFLSLLYSI